jgi:peroxiredoxin
MQNAVSRQQPLHKEPVLQIRYNTSTVLLDDMPLDIGYASERIDLKKSSGETFRIGGQNGATQLIIATPFIDEELLTQLREIDTLLSLNALGGVTKGLVVATDKHHDPRLEEWQFGFDGDEGFGDYYGVRLSPGELGGEFAKALFVISKDGALFYHEILSDLNGAFSLDKALVKIAAAQSCYTGKGCHG